jgi:peptidoglycan biosynthesis protein MviN/MurJ (putative lipid II flippase)
MLIPFLSRHSIPIVQWATVLLLLVYMVQSLRYLYRQSWPKTILKSVIATSLLFFLMLVTMAIYESFPLIPALPRVLQHIQELRSLRPK